MREGAKSNITSRKDALKEPSINDNPHVMPFNVLGTEKDNLF